MGRMRWVLACVPLVVAATALGGGVAGARGTGPCAEDPSDCGLAPTITAVSATATAKKARLSATINPGDQQTAYEIWISYAPCQGGAGECPKPIQKEEVAGGSIPYKRPRDVKAIIGLTPGCTYGYWFVASNERGTVETEHEYFVAAGGEPRSPKACGR